MIDDILLFVQVVSAGSILAVERRLNIPKSTISRRIQGLEANFGGTLMNRSSKGIALTMLGHNIYNKFKDYESELSDLLNEVTHPVAEASGMLNILLPYTFAFDYVIPNISEVLLANPRLKINIRHNFHEFNMHKENYDIAIVNYIPRQQTQKIRLLSTDKILVVCTPEYIERKGYLEVVEDCKKHIIPGKLTPDGVLINQAPLYNEKTEEIIMLELDSRIIFSSFVEAKLFIKNHQGVSAFPSHYIKDELEAGELIRVLPDYHAGLMSYYIMRNIPENDKRYQVFYTFISAYLPMLGSVDGNVELSGHFFHG